MAVPRSAESQDSKAGGTSVADSKLEGVNFWEFLLKVMRSSPTGRLARRLVAGLSVRSHWAIRSLSSFFGCLLFYTHVLGVSLLSGFQGQETGIVSETQLLMPILLLLSLSLLIIVAPAVAAITACGVRKGSPIIHFFFGTLLPAFSYAMAV